MTSALPDAVRHHEAHCHYGQNAAPEGPGPHEQCGGIWSGLQEGTLRGAFS